MILKHFSSFRASAGRRRDNAIRSGVAHRKALLLCSLLCVALIAGCSGGDDDTITNPDTSSSGTSSETSGNATGEDQTDGGGVNTTTEAFGDDGLPAFRLRGNNNGFNLTEGESITIPVSIDRINGHQETVTLEIDQQQDGLLVSTLDRNSLDPGQTQATLRASFLHGRQRAAEQQRAVTINATDGQTSSQVVVLLNIRPTSLPDIYLLVGQSNMVGLSENNARDIDPGGLDEPNPLIEQLNVTANDYTNFDSVEKFRSIDAQVAFPDFIVAEDPLHTSKDPSLEPKTGKRVGMGLTFAKRALINDGSHRIVLVPAAWSSSGFCDTGEILALFGEAPEYIEEGELGWNPFEQTNPVFGGTTLFDRAVLRANIAIQRKNGILRGILWHQGESDGDNPACAADYAENFAMLASELRTRIIPDARGEAARGATSDVPFIAGTMSRGSDVRGNFSVLSESKQIVDNAHRNIGAQGLIPHYGVANLDDITPPNFRCGESSCVHFGAAAYREIGNRYFQTLQSVLSQP